MLDSLAPLTRVLGKAGTLLQEYSPQILTAMGIAGGATAAVMAVKATPQMEPVVAELETGLSNIAEALEIDAYEDEKEATKDRLYLYRRAAVGTIKVYGPAITLGAASVCFILAAHGILQKRNAILLAAYQTMEKSFSDYRARVIADRGVEADQEYLTAKKSVEKQADDGATVTEEVIDPGYQGQPYRFFFSSETSHHWRHEPDMNYYYLAARQNYWNDRLKARGQVFLNEVLNDLGFDHTDVGAITGWVWQGEGDNVVDFGFEPARTEQARAFLDGRLPDVWLDFNVDGVIIGKGLLNKKHLR